MDQIKPEFLKILTKFIIFSIWVLSLLATHNFYSYRFIIIQLVTHALDKKYLFLFCNGLLVFVAKFSGLIASSETTEENWSKADNRGFDSYDDRVFGLEYYSVHERKTESFLAEEVNESQEDYETVSLHVNSTEADAKDEETEERDDVEEYDKPSTDNADTEQECDLRDGFKEEEANVVVITEEDMNKKFDEFIRKMKEELRIEAKRHLILV